MLLSNGSTSFTSHIYNSYINSKMNSVKVSPEKKSSRRKSSKGKLSLTTKRPRFKKPARKTFFFCLLEKYKSIFI